MLTQETIIAGLKKIGPCSPGQLADHLEVETSALSYHLKKLLDAGTVKATGATGTRRVALADQKFDDASTPTPPQHKRKPKGGRKAKHARKAHHAPARTEPAERFIPAVDAHQRLVIVNGAEPLIFSDEQTAAIADLLLQHYKA